VRRTVRPLVAVLAAAALAGCGSHDSSSPPASPVPSGSSSAPSTPSSSAAAVTCPTNLSAATEVASIPTGAGRPALAIGGTNIYAVTATGTGGATEVTVVGLTGTTTGPTPVPAAGATVALGAGTNGAILLSVDTKAPGLIASFVAADGRVTRQVPLPDEDASGATSYGAQMIGDTAYVGTKAGTVLALQEAKRGAEPVDLPTGLVPLNVLLTGGPYLTMSAAADVGTATQTIEVVDPATGDTVGSYSGAFFSDSDGDPVAIRNDLLIEVTTGSSVTVLGNANGFGSDVVAAAFCRKFVYALNSQLGLDMIDLASGKTLTSTTLQGLQPDKVTVAAVPSGLVVLGSPVGDDQTVDIRLIPAG
jgi:hypothetical protein